MMHESEVGRPSSTRASLALLTAAIIVAVLLTAAFLSG